MVKKDSSSSDLEKAYNELKASFYQNFTKFTMFLMILTSMIEIIRAIYLANPSILINPLGSLVLGLVLYKYVSKKIFIFTLFTIVALTVSLYGHYTSTGYFNNPSDIFYFAYAFAFLERLFGDRIPTAKEKAFFSLANALIRIIIVPLNDKGLLAIQAIFLLSLTFCDFNQESRYKELFGSYYQSKDQLRKFKDLVENYIPDGIIVIDQNSKKNLFVNNAFKGLFEFSQVSDVKSQLDSFHLCDSLESSSESYLINSSNNLSQSLLGLLSRDFSRGSRCTSEKYHLAFSKQNSVQSSKKEEKIFEARILNIVWDEVPAFAIVLHDITQQQTILKLKVAADLNKDKILATVSHELRTPLNGILGVIQIMNKKIHDPELLQYLKICKNSTNLLIGLVNSILDLNQIRANKLKLSYDKVQLPELLKDIVYLFEFQCNQKNILLDLYISPKTPTTIVTDKNRLTQIFINLLGNALKFTMQGSITITVEESSHPDMIQFSVKDTGMGIKEEDKDKLFMMYGRLDQDDDKINQQGVGLGLTISNNLAHLLCEDDRLGGIKVESEYKQGSAFTFLIRTNLSNIKHRKMESGLLIDSYQTISEGFFGEFEAIGQKMRSYQTPPIKRRSVVPEITTCAQSPRKSIGSQKNNRKTSSTPTILIVDDNPFNITIATELINMEGFNVKSALYGQTAIDIALNNDYKTEPIELILMDCQMPVMDGYETTKILANLIRDGKIPDIPIVALTANNNSMEEREECRKAGMCDYLTKPLREANLAQVLRKYTSKHDTY